MLRKNPKLSLRFLQNKKADAPIKGTEFSLWATYQTAIVSFFKASDLDYFYTVLLRNFQRLTILQNTVLSFLSWLLYSPLQVRNLQQENHKTVI